jgi:RNA polymerase sigma-70 factor (ECF subfamily)
VSDDHLEPTDPAVRVLIRRKAGQLIGRAGLTRQDTADLEQELLLHLLERLPGIACHRTYPEALVLTVLYRAAANVLRSRRAAKRDYRRARPLHPGDEARAVRAGSGGRGAEQLAELAGDVAAVLITLPPEERDLAERLTRQSLAEVARETGVARTTLYGAVRRLRVRFERAGLKDYL